MNRENEWEFYFQPTLLQSKYYFILVYIGCSVLNNVFLSNSGSDYEGGEEDENEEEYDELDHRGEGQFWVTNDDGVEYAVNEDWMEDSVEEKHAKPEPVISLFALGTLCRYTLAKTGITTNISRLL